MAKVRTETEQVELTEIFDKLKEGARLIRLSIYRSYSKAEEVSELTISQIKDNIDHPDEKIVYLEVIKYEDKDDED